MIEIFMQNHKLIYEFGILRINMILEDFNDDKCTRRDLVLYSSSLSCLPLSTSILSASWFRLPP